MKAILFLCFVIICCSPKAVQTISSKAENNSYDSLYRIYKIDSLNSYYLVYAKRQDTLYKIVSRKDMDLSCQKIKIGMEYDLKLSSIWKADFTINGITVSPASTPHVTCLSFDDTTKICLERDSINDLHMAENLRGLCLFEK